MQIHSIQGNNFTQRNVQQQNIRQRNAQHKNAPSFGSFYVKGNANEFMTKIGWSDFGEIGKAMLEQARYKGLDTSFTTRPKSVGFGLDGRTIVDPCENVVLSLVERATGKEYTSYKLGEILSDGTVKSDISQKEFNAYLKDSTEIVKEFESINK